MSSLKIQRCFNHALREAVARCTVCGSFFCRECIAEHAGRMTCARCLESRSSASGRGRLLSQLAGFLKLALGIFILWFCFFMAGRALLAIPSSFHEGTLWHQAGGGK